MQEWVLTLEVHKPEDITKVTSVVRHAAKLGLIYKVRSRELAIKEDKHVLVPKVSEPIDVVGPDLGGHKGKISLR